MKAYFAITAITSVLIAASLTGCVTTPMQTSEATVARSLEQITPTVYGFKNNNHKALIILTDDGAVLVDPISPDAALWVSNEIQSRFGKSITHVLYSHAHHDHASGAAVLGVPVIGHANAVLASSPKLDQTITGPNMALDVNGDNALSRDEANAAVLARFDAADIDGDNSLSAKELFIDLHRNVKTPDQTYSGAVNRLNLGGRAVEMHHIACNHTQDLSYIYLPDEKLVFIVDVHSLGALPFGDLPWYSHDDWRATIDKALGFDADIVVSGHGKIGTKDDIRELDNYMTALRVGVQGGINNGHSLEQIKADVTLPQFAHMEFYERIGDNIDGMYRVLTTG